MRIALYFLAATTLYSAAPSQASLSWNPENFSLLAHSMPMENASSLGEDRFHLGVGISNPQLPDASNLQRLLTTDSNEPSSGTHVWLKKSLFYPLDLGIEGAMWSSLSLYRVAAYLQWTVYEKRGTPAVALRGGYTKVFHRNLDNFNSFNIGLVSSWGYKAFTAFLAYQGNLHSLDLRTSSMSSKAQQTPNIDENWLDHHGEAGISIQLLPPYLTTTLATAFTLSSLENIALKANFQL